MIRLALAAFLLAGSARAGVIYHFTSQTVTKNGSVSVAGRVWADGHSHRLQLDPRPERPHQYEIAISLDANQTATWINEEKRTYEKRTRNADSRTSLLFHLPGMKSRVKGKPRIKHERLDNDVVVARPVTKHFIEVDYDLRGDLDGTEVRGHVRTEITIWTDKELPRLPFERAVQTGFPALDAAIAKIYVSLRGMTLRSEMTVTRILEGGPPISETTATTIDELEIAEIEPARFAMPL